MTPLMSFWPKIYDKIFDQIKLIEHRRTFPKDCTHAYMYISSPVKAVCGIVYFGKIHSLLDWKTLYSNETDIIKRIDDYSSYRYGAEITGFQKIKPITLADLRNNVTNFVAPQSYCLLENNDALENYIKKSTVLVGDKVKNDLTEIYPEHICKQY